jgi:hypothetical protein
MNAHLPSRASYLIYNRNSTSSKYDAHKGKQRPQTARYASTVERPRENRRPQSAKVRTYEELSKNFLRKEFSSLHSNSISHACKSELKMNSLEEANNLEERYMNSHILMKKDSEKAFSYNSLKYVSGISRKINSRTITPKTLTLFSDDLLHTINSRNLANSRPSSASSLKKISYKPTVRHSSFKNFYDRSISTKTLIVNPKPPVNNEVGHKRATTEPSFNKIKTRRLVKENIAGFTPNLGARLFEKSAIPKEILEAYRPKKRGLPMHIPGPYSVVLASHSARYSLNSVNLSTSRIPIMPTNVI